MATWLQWGEGLHVYVEQAKRYLTPFIASMSCLPSGCQWSPFKGMASFAMSWVDSKQKTGRQRRLGSMLQLYHAIWLQLAPFVMARGRNCDFQGRFCMTEHFWSLCTKWLGWQPCLVWYGEEKEEYLSCLCKFVLCQILIVLTNNKRMNNIKTNQ